LRDRGVREGNGDAVVSMSMVERAFAGWQSQMNDNHGLILQHHMMKRLVFNEHRRRGILRRKDKGREKENYRIRFRSHSSCIPPWAKQIEPYRTSVFHDVAFPAAIWPRHAFERDGGTYTPHSMHECENKGFAKWA